MKEDLRQQIDKLWGDALELRDNIDWIIDEHYSDTLADASMNRTFGTTAT